LYDNLRLSVPEGQADNMLVMTSPPVKKHYPFVDGIRGLTAFYVVLNHIWTRFVATAEASTLPQWFHLLKFGHAAVAIFIVLSGFCLMLPLTQREGFTLAGGWKGFLQRRARRILPAYYAAMLVSLLLGALVPVILPPHSREWQSLLTHLLLVQNWTPRWSIAINGPFWSIALEWQIYFLFALLLLPVRRQFGRLAALGVASTLVALPLFLRLGGTSPWFLLLFFQGMLAAEWVAHPPRLSLGLLAGLTTVLVLLSAAVELTIWRDSFPWPSRAWQQLGLLLTLDILLGSATMAVLLLGTRPNLPAPFSWCFSLLGHRVFLFLGSYSYSIYLLHDPLLALGLSYATPLIVAAPMQAFPFVLATVLPVTLGLCWLFHLAFERPFLRASTNTRITN
jgi:peptidoglycan/LPS O-acetylase OafA/YrhL